MSNRKIILSVLLVFCMLTGCRNQVPGEDNAITENTQTQGSADSVSKLTNYENTPELKKFLSVLYNEVPFVPESGRDVYMKDFSISDISPVYVVPDKYTCVDFDRDGTYELVVHFQPDFRGYLVLCLYGETVFGYEFGERSMMDLKADGTFTGSGGAGLHTYVSMHFNENKYILTELAYQNETAERREYRIHGGAATESDYRAFYNKYDQKPDAQWTAVDVDRWQKSVDSIAEKYCLVYKTGENFTIYTDQEEIPSFYYTVKDKNGVEIDRGYHNSRHGVDLEYQNGLLVLHYGGSAHIYLNRYYDISGSRMSRFFSCPVADSESLIAYYTSEDNQIKLIVQDIFDVNVFYKVIDRDFSSSVFRMNFKGEIFKGEFIENNTKLRVTYPVDNSNEPVTEEIPLDK